MKLLPKSEHHLAFELDEIETQLLEFTLSAYPLAPEPWTVPPTALEDENTPPPSGAPDPELLSSSLKEMKASHQNRMQQFLTGPGFSKNPEGGSRINLPLEDVDWFMQVLNELRVASWYRLDCPDEDVEWAGSLKPEQLQEVLRMDFTGMVLDGILRALEARGS